MQIDYSEMPSEMLVILWRMEKKGYEIKSLRKLNKNLIAQLLHKIQPTENIVYNFLSEKTHVEQACVVDSIKFYSEIGYSIKEIKPEGETLKEIIENATLQSPIDAYTFTVLYKRKSPTFHNANNGEMILK